MPRIPAPVLRIVFPASRLLLLVLLSPVVQSADVNGYTAEYECRAGGPRCDVDVAALGQRECSQTITPATPWSSINWENNTICLQAGDHTAKGLLTIPSTANGTVTNYKVLRYVPAGGTEDTDDDPWAQSSGNQAQLSRLEIRGNYWLVHRLVFPSINGNIAGGRIKARRDANNIVFNRLLVEGNRSSSNYYGYTPEDCDATPSDITIQNSVFRNVGPIGPGKEAIAINFPCGNDMHAVNNEIYDWVSHPIQLGRNTSSDGSRVLMLNTVVENNDFYVTNALYTDCAGNFTSTGPCAANESVISTKLRAAAGGETKMIHNRVWGTRYTDLNLCCNGTTGQAIGNYDNNDYVLFHNNIIMDAQMGINNAADNNSFIGNLFYWIRAFRSDKSAHTINRWNSNDGGAPAWEAYLNSVILAEENSFPHLKDPNLDIRCNAFIDSGPKATGTPLSSSIADYNAFYGTPSFAFNGTNTTVDRQLRLRENNANYLVGDVVRRSSNPKNDCTVANDADCFLYKVTQAGTTASTSPAYCTTLGCSTTDGGVVVKAIRGPYVFKRKLRTVPGGETVVIPYAQVHADADEANFCPGEGQANAVGLRTGIGVNDDVAWNGILNADLIGTERTGTAGSLENRGDDAPPPGGGSGTILREHWTGINGVFVTDLTSHPSYPGSPTGTEQLPLFEAPVNWADNYGTRIRGYVHPPVNGTYTFWIASDDHSELWLSTDDNPANKIRIAWVDAWTKSREWTKYASQQSVAISLNAGQKYYVEALQKEGSGGDNVAVGWQLPGGTFERPIGGNRLSPFVPASQTYTAQQTGTPPTIDGDVSEFAGAEPIQLSNANGTRGTYRLIYDANALYIAADVTDVHLNHGGTGDEGSLWGDDSIELMLDTLHDHGASRQSDDYKFFVNVNGNRRDEQGISAAWNGVWSHAARVNGTINNNTDTDTGYTIEMAIPWSTLGYVSPPAGATIGLDVVMNDRDAAGSRTIAAWFTPAGASLNAPDNWGHMAIGEMPPSPPTSTPFYGTPLSIPGLVEAEDFDNGGEGVAYHDVDAGNNGNSAYRSTDVDLTADQGASNGTAVSWARTGEWLKHTVNVATAGNYTLEVRVAANGEGGTFHIEFDGVDKTGPIAVPNTGGWSTWQTLSRMVTLDAGEQTMRLVMDSVGPTNGSVGNFDYVRLGPPIGTILREYWLGISGDSVAQLTSHPNYPDNPSGGETLAIFEGPLDWADNYGTRIRGYVHPPTTGNYVFWIASDNDSELWLSTDDNPMNRIRIAWVNGWTNSREWTKFASQQSVPITLTAGQRYYIEALHKEGLSGDRVAVGWQLPNATLERPIPGNRLSPP